jgi:hypothetical protein
VRISSIRWYDEGYVYWSQEAARSNAHVFDRWNTWFCVRILLRV